MLSERQIGFTLIELVTTLAVSTMLIAMAVPGVNTFLMNSRQSSGINNLVSAMHLARSTAITKNTRITVCVSSDGEDCDSSDWNQGWIVFADADADQTVDAGEIILGAGAAVTGLTIESTEFSRFFMYRPNGRVMNATVNANSGEFIVCDSRGDEHVRVIIVDSAGRPRLSETRSNGSAPSCS